MNAIIVLTILSFATLISARFGGRHHHENEKRGLDNSIMDPDELFAIGLKQAFRTVHAVQKVTDANDGFGIKMASRALDDEKRGMKRKIILDNIRRVKKVNADADSDKWGSSKNYERKWMGKGMKGMWGKKSDGADMSSGSKMLSGDSKKLSKDVTLNADKNAEKKLNIQKKGKVEGVKSVKVTGSKVASGTFSASWKSEMIKSIRWGNQNLTETDRIAKEGRIVGVMGSDGRKAVNVVKVIKADGNKSIEGNSNEAKGIDVNKHVKAE